MSIKIINISNNDNNDNWLVANTFIKQWQSDSSFFNLTTSGSTGIPKTIRITRQQMIASAKQTIHTLQLQTNDQLLVCINTKFIGGIMMLVRGLVGNMNLFIDVPTSNPLKHISKPIDFMAVVPLQLQSMLLEGEVKKLNNMKSIIVGGAAVSRSLQNKIEQLTVPVYATYGMTETASHIALKQLNGPKKDVFFNVLGDTVIKTDDRACLTITGSVTNHKIIKTNDLVNIVDPQKFEWLGRFDNVINSGGVKIPPELVEVQIDSIFEEKNIKRRFFIFGMDDELLGQKVVLLIEGVEFDILNLASTLKNEMKKYHSPKVILFISDFVETETGKVDRQTTIKEMTK